MKIGDLMEETQTQEAAAPKASRLSVASAVKDVIKKAGMNCGGDFVDALDKKVEMLVNDAVSRAKSNDRKTVRSGDL